MITINGTDISTLGVVLLRGGDVDLFCFPERKQPTQNDWFEHDGLDVDMSEVYFNARKIAFKFRLKAISTADFNTKLNAFQSLIYASGTKSIYLSSVNKTYSLRLVSISDFKMISTGMLNSGEKKAEFSCEFLEDAPLASVLSNLTPASGVFPLTNVKLNSVDLSQFSVLVKKIYNSTLAIPSPKKALERTLLRRNGIIADTGVLKKTARPIAIECRMTAENIGELWTNWSALFNQLNRYDITTYKNGIRLLINDSDLHYCYFQSMSNVQKKMNGNQLILDFTLNIIDTLYTA